jgi:dihydrofolate reductase
MRKLASFTNISLDGFFADAKSDMSWAHKAPTDTEWNEFTAANASGGGTLLFGRVTYDMMAGFWPTPMATQMMPEVAKGMNAMPKFVASRTMKKADWQNTTVLHGDLVTAVRKLKSEPGDDIAILGSGSIVAQLADAGLIDTFQVAVAPIVLGDGKALFHGIKNRLNLKLTDSRTFKNGSVVLWYEPAK